MWYWRRKENISRPERVKKAVVDKVKEESNILKTVKRRQVNWVGDIFHRNCLIKHVIDGKIEGTRRRGRSYKHKLMSSRKRDNTGN